MSSNETYEEFRSLDLRRTAYIGIASFGFISLFGDIIYEGARSIIPSYLEFLGATALIVGLATGIGEFLGYSLRLVSGYLADTTKSYWLFMIVGYTLLIAMPLMAFAGHWLVAVLLILVERTAKALRSPSRDTLLSVITKGMGAGKAFGLHEMMDQIGATVGPAIMAIILFYTYNDFFWAFLSLLIPYFILVGILFTVYFKLKRKTIYLANHIDLSEKRKPQHLTLEFKLYTLAVLLNTAGLVHISIILYSATMLTPVWMVSILYLVLQGVDAFIAPISGHFYDKYGKNVLSIPFLLSIVPSVFVFFGTFESIIVAVVFFGTVLGMQESIYRAAITDLTSVKKRGIAYGIFNTAYGGGFLVSGAIFGWLLDNIAILPSFTLLGHILYIPAFIYTIVLQAIALGLLSKLKAAREKENATSE